MSTKHTPGPWHSIGPGLGHTAGMDKRIMVLHPDHTRLIANCSEGYIMPNGEAITEKERIANALLIAAAPETAAERDKLREINRELLDALKRIANMEADMSLDIATRSLLLIGEAKTTAETAIAKAEGMGA